MGWWDVGYRVLDAVRNSMPPCHVCGEGGAQICKQCGRVACHKHAYTNVRELRSVCIKCLTPHFPWVLEQSVAPDWDEPVPPWEILGVSADASLEEIKVAYRNLSKEQHSDVNGGSDDGQKRLNKAHEAMRRMRGV